MSASPSEAEHLDVLVVGAGMSGVGAGRYLRTEHPQRPSPSLRPGRRPVAPGTCFDTRASARTPTCTPSATSSSRGGTKESIASAPRILAYLRRRPRRTAWMATSATSTRSWRRTGPPSKRAGTSRWSVPTPVSGCELHRRLDLLCRRLLPIRRGVHAPLRGPRAVPGARSCTRRLGPRTSTTPASGWSSSAVVRPR